MGGQNTDKLKKEFDCMITGVLKMNLCKWKMLKKFSPLHLPTPFNKRKEQIKRVRCWPCL